MTVNRNKVTCINFHLANSQNLKKIDVSTRLKSILFNIINDLYYKLHFDSMFKLHLTWHISITD